MTDFKTPLATVRGLGSAKEGTHHWWMQRLTALANIPLTIFIIISFVGNVGKPHADWVAWMKQPLVSVLLSLFVINMLYHLKMGLQVAIEDYIHDKGARILTMVILHFIVILMGATSLFSILRVALAG